MNLKQTRTIRGLLIIAGLVTSKSILLYGKVKSVTVYVFALIALPIFKTAQRILKGLQALENFRYSPIGFAQRRGVFNVNEGIGILLSGIFAVIYLYFVAYSVPGALVAIATTALTSVNGGVQTIFQVLFSIVAVFTFLLILVAVVQKVVSQ
jgi:hypothetical protein